MNGANDIIPGRIGDHGRLIIPPETAARYGLAAGARFLFRECDDHLRITRAVHHLAEVYVEPTNACNLHCRTCIRNSWTEPTGMMSDTTFARIIVGITELTPRPLVFFGGFGEPLAHPRIIAMVQAAKHAGAPVELITNGTLLDEAMARGLIAAGIDRLWVSLDGAQPQSYADVRLGAQLPRVLANVRRFRDLRAGDKPQLGIAYVAMRRNIGDLPDLLGIAAELGASDFHVSHVLPYTAELDAERLYPNPVNIADHAQSEMRLHLPRIDDGTIIGAISEAMLPPGIQTYLAGIPLDSGRDRCPFIERGSTAIAWDGGMSPCLELLHEHTSFLNGTERQVHRYVIGNVRNRGLVDLWTDSEYASFRERVAAFTFSPCTTCGSCPLAQENGEDCYGNPAPSCGGCLWAQGYIRCP